MAANPEKMALKTYGMHDIFDPRRRAVLLVGGDKSGVSGKRFYKRLVMVADERYDVHLTRVKSQKKR